MTLIDVVGVDSHVAGPEWLARAEAVHRQLRPDLPADYAAKMARVFAGGGRMLLATREGAVLGVAIWRSYENTVDGRFVYVDDLVVDAVARSGGVGRTLLSGLVARAKALGCAALTLDSGTQRHRAHAFYLREGLRISSFHFAVALAPDA